MKTLKLTAKNIRRSPYQSMAAFLMTTITFFVVTIFSIIIYATHQLLTYVESRPQVTAFFLDKTARDDVQTLEDKLSSTGLVQDMKYVSQDEALEIYKSQNKDNALLLEMVTADILPSSLEVSGKSVKDLDALADTLKSDTHVEEVVYQKDVADTLKKWVDGIRIGGLVITSLLLLASLVTIVVILGMRVAARRSEIKTLSLLGASSWYIRAPFLSEGLVYSEFGVLVGWGSAYLLILYLTPNLLDFFAGIPLFPLPIYFVFSVLGIEVIISFLLGVFASLSATRRYGR